MNLPQEVFDAAVAPVRGWLAGTACAEADRIRTEARGQAEAMVAAAQQEAEGIRRAAAAEGEAAAEAEASLRWAGVRRRAHETVLAAQEALRLELQRQVLDAVAAIRTDPRYGQFLERQYGQARALLGPDAVVGESPDGGVIAEAGSRRLDLSLPALAVRTLEFRMREVRKLWVP